MQKYYAVGRLLILSGLLYFPVFSNAEENNEPVGLKTWNPPGTAFLPPVEKRKIIGTWYSRTLKATRSFEQVDGKYYEILRSKSKTGGNDGLEIVKAGKNKFKKKAGSRFGDYYVINADGSLGIFDHDGLVDTLPIHSGLWPSEATIAAAEAAVRKPDVQDTPERKNKIKAQFSSWDGSHRTLEKLIKEGMNDPKSYEHVETSYTDMGTYLIVKTTFRGKNSFGALVKNTVNAKASLDGDILKIISQY